MDISVWHWADITYAVYRSNFPSSPVWKSDEELPSNIYIYTYIYTYIYIYRWNWKVGVYIVFLYVHTLMRSQTIGMIRSWNCWLQPLVTCNAKQTDTLWTCKVWVWTVCSVLRIIAHTFCLTNTWCFLCHLQDYHGVISFIPSAHSQISGSNREDSTHPLGRTTVFYHGRCRQAGWSWAG